MKVVPEGAPYSYGSRLRGVPAPPPEEPCEVPSCGRGRGHEGGHALWPDEEEWNPDQIKLVEKLLGEKPDTRAAFLTPWRPLEDAGKESGRPCLTGLWLRVEPSLSYANAGVAEGQTGTKIDPRGILHLVVAFRSHDLCAAYPTNLAGIMLWQQELAERLRLRVGSLTCTSYSAHVYEHDWTAAESVIEKHYDTHREPRWDQRSTWYVERVEPVVEEKPVVVGERLEVPRSASGVIDVWEVQAEPAGDGMVVIENLHTRERPRIQLHQWRENRGDYRGPRLAPTLRATALSPDGEKVLRVFEAETPEGLRALIERSGLVTSVGAALWLGDEIRKVGGNA